jgi:isocitrate dehydrogenase
MGWFEAANLITNAYEATVAEKIVTYDFARQMDDAQTVATSEFATAIIDRM